MKNLFDYANKELSQDSLLSWLFASWEDSDIKPIIMDLLTNFGVSINYEDILNIYILKQICKIDVTIVIEIKNKVHLIFIEDKTNSNVHNNQLLVYDSKIFGGPLNNNLHCFKVLEDINYKLNRPLIHVPRNDFNTIYFSNIEVHRIFYKTSIITEEDTKFLNECKILPNTFSARYCASNIGWKVFNIFDIYNILSKYQDSNNLILNMYIQHIVKVYNLSTTNDIPNTDNTQEWYLYFVHNFKQYFEDMGYLVSISSYLGKNVSIRIKCKTNEDNLSFDNRLNEHVCILFNNLSYKTKSFYLVLSTDDISNNELINYEKSISELKTEIQNLHDGFMSPFKLKNSYLKTEAKTIAYAKLSCDDTDHIKQSLVKCLETLNRLDHDSKMIFI